ncbi:RimK family alpha-L-glutamate ligase [Candidatus Woesearchaeota archaeon]|nr:RimK family alpha-L-glutamate ligase [Candidatus Woesearchaeota archaeon]
MKAAIISLGSKSSVMTAEAMQKYFDSVDMIQLKQIEVCLGKDASILYEGKELGNYDCIYVKGSYRYANLLCSLASMLEGKIAYMPFFANAFTTVHNKLLTHLVLQQHKIPMPRTYITSTIAAAKDLLKRVNYPVVMKFPEGTQGKGVMFADSYGSASSLLDALGVLNQPFIIQEYVETGGADIRAFVVGDKVIAAMRRKAHTHEKRANIHAGGVGQSVQLGREVMKLAVTTARALGADICGVDILESPLGPLVIEANISPGLQGLSKVSTVDIPDEIAKFLFFKTQEKVEERKKLGAVQVMKELDMDPEATQDIVSTLQFRGEKIVLPEIANRIARFTETKEYVITAKKGQLEIKEMK